MGQLCVGVSSLQVEQQVAARCHCGDQTTPPTPMSVVTASLAQMEQRGPELLLEAELTAERRAGLQLPVRSHDPE